MNNDVLEWPDAEERQPPPHWQQRQAAPEAQPREIEAPSLLFPADRVYVPFETRMRPESLILLTATGPAQAPAYFHLSNPVFDQFYGQHLTLFYPFMTVLIRGQRLAEVIHAVVHRRCAIIREWHRDLYEPPTRGIPVIESITITPMGEEPESPGQAPNH